eukprot:PhF_6_TR4833/c0_g1_i1/m.6723
MKKSSWGGAEVTAMKSKGSHHRGAAPCSPIHIPPPRHGSMPPSTTSLTTTATASGSLQSGYNAWSQSQHHHQQNYDVNHSTQRPRCTVSTSLLPSSSSSQFGYQQSQIQRSSSLNPTALNMNTSLIPGKNSGGATWENSQHHHFSSYPATHPSATTTLGSSQQAISSQSYEPSNTLSLSVVPTTTMQAAYVRGTATSAAHPSFEGGGAGNSKSFTASNNEAATVTYYGSAASNNTTAPTTATTKRFRQDHDFSSGGDFGTPGAALQTIVHAMDSNASEMNQTAGYLEGSEVALCVLRRRTESVIKRQKEVVEKIRKVVSIRCAQNTGECDLFS